MTWMHILTIVIAALLSGLVGVGISNWYHNRNETRRTKLSVMQQLLGNRHDLKGQLFTEALNQIFVIFYDSKEVIVALKEFHAAIINSATHPDIKDQKLMELFKAMCKHLKINIEPLTDNYFLQVFNVKKN